MPARRLQGTHASSGLRGPSSSAIDPGCRVAAVWTPVCVCAGVHVCGSTLGLATRARETRAVTRSREWTTAQRGSLWRAGRGGAPCSAAHSRGADTPAAARSRQRATSRSREWVGFRLRCRLPRAAPAVTERTRVCWPKQSPDTPSVAVSLRGTVAALERVWVVLFPGVILY